MPSSRLIFPCFLVALLVTSLVLHAEEEGAEKEGPKDRVEILSISPSEPVKRGVETTFIVDVEADLQSSYEGVAMIGFNTQVPVAFRMEDSRLLEHGMQRFTFEVEAVPVDWGDRGKFRVLVNMGPYWEGAVKWEPTASVRATIETEP